MNEDLKLLFGGLLEGLVFRFVNNGTSQLSGSFFSPPSLTNWFGWDNLMCYSLTWLSMYASEHCN